MGTDMSEPLATQFQENGVLKCKCPECGHVTQIDSEFSEVIAYVCLGCNKGFECDRLKPTIQ